MNDETNEATGQESPEATTTTETTTTETPAADAAESTEPNEVIELEEEPATEPKVAESTIDEAPRNALAEILADPAGNLSDESGEAEPVAEAEGEKLAQTISLAERKIEHNGHLVHIADLGAGRVRIRPGSFCGPTYEADSEAEGLAQVPRFK